MKFTDIFTLKPVNALASKSINQKGCKSSLTPEQQYSNAILAKQAILDKKHELNKELIESGYNIENIDLEISRIKELIKAERIKDYHSKISIAQEKKRKRLLMSNNEDLKIHSELKKLLKSRMDYGDYVSLMQEATRNAKL